MEKSLAFLDEMINKLEKSIGEYEEAPNPCSDKIECSEKKECSQKNECSEQKKECPQMKNECSQMKECCQKQSECCEQKNECCPKEKVCEQMKECCQEENKCPEMKNACCQEESKCPEMKNECCQEESKCPEMKACAEQKECPTKCEESEKKEEPCQAECKQECEETKAPEEQKPQKKKKQKKKKKKKAPKSKPRTKSLFEQVEFRVGEIKSCFNHPESTKLYIEKIDMGEGEDRTILSGLQNVIPIEKMTGLVVVWANLKARPLAGIPSFGMVMCSQDAKKGGVECLRPSEGAKIGDRVYLDNMEDYLWSQYSNPALDAEGNKKPLDFSLESYLEEEGLKPMNSKKMKKMFAQLKTDQSGAPCFGTYKMITKSGGLKTAGVPNGIIQ